MHNYASRRGDWIIKEATKPQISDKKTFFINIYMCDLSKSFFIPCLVSNQTEMLLMQDCKK